MVTARNTTRITRVVLVFILSAALLLFNASRNAPPAHATNMTSCSNTDGGLNCHTLYVSGAQNVDRVDANRLEYGYGISAGGGSVSPGVVCQMRAVVTILAEDNTHVASYQSAPTYGCKNGQDTVSVYIHRSFAAGWRLCTTIYEGQTQTPGAPCTTITPNIDVAALDCQFHAAGCDPQGPFLQFSSLCKTVGTC